MFRIFSLLDPTRYFIFDGIKKNCKYFGFSKNEQCNLDIKTETKGCIIRKMESVGSENQLFFNSIDYFLSMIFFDKSIIYIFYEISFLDQLIFEKIEL